MSKTKSRLVLVPVLSSLWPAIKAISAGKWLKICTKKNLRDIENLMQELRIQQRYCRECGCSDFRACVISAGPCSWVIVDKATPTGICSRCYYGKAQHL